jgi:hypothetical protein
VSTIIDDGAPRDHGKEAELLASRQRIWRSDAAVLVYLACATIVVHVLMGERYGFHRDELATLTTRAILINAASSDPSIQHHLIR